MTRRGRSIWDSQPVSAVADVNPTTAFPHGPRTVPSYEMASIDETTGELREPAMVESDTGQSGKSKFRNGDVLFGRITPCVQNRKSALAQGIPGDFALGSTEFYVLRPKRGLIPEYLFYFLRQQKIIDAAVASFTGTSGRQRVPRSFWDSLSIPVPWLPVQERIVQILQKADEVRRKRMETLETTDATLPAMFREIFGEPQSNPRDWKIDLLGKYLVETRYGTSAKTGEYEGGYPVLRIPNVIRRTIDTSELKYLKASDTERKKLRLESDDILVVRTNGNKDYVGRCAVFDLEDEYLFASYLIRLRVDPAVLNPHYVVAYLATSTGRREIDTNSRTSAGQYNISVAGLRAIRIPVPPIGFQRKFVDQYEQWKVSQSRLAKALSEAEDLFSGLLSRAFTGDLTLKWEAANADGIAAQQALHERLPRLAVLALLAEKAKRASRAEPEVLVTAMMKYVFLFQMEGNGGQRRLYHFVPYHYGPFAKELYAELETLQGEGLVRVDNDPEEEKTRITVVDPAKVNKLLADLPEDLKADAATIIETYGDLGHGALLKAVYEKYPAYAKKSRLLRRRRS